MNVEDLIQKLPPEARKSFRAFLDTLPQRERESIGALFKGLPSDGTPVRNLLNLSVAQVKQAFGQKHRVAIVGPANVGKSTLYNQFIQAKEDKAEVSPVPGTTRRSQSADAGLFAVVDTPGADAVGEVGEAERANAFQAASSADILIIMFDAIQGVKRAEQDLFYDLAALGKPYVVVLNKIDLVRREESEVVNGVATNLGLSPEQIVPIAAKDGKNLGQVLMAVAAAEPQMIAALGRALPQYRWQLAWRSIVSAASVSAAIALTPLPVIDFVPLVATQAVMVMGIARIYNYEITPKRARELIATFGLGLLGRTLFAELSKLGGLPGWLLSSAVATSTTVVMGMAAAAWFERGERMSRDTLDAMTRKMTAQMLAALKSLGSRRPAKESLKQRVEAALQEAANDAQALRRP